MDFTKGIICHMQDSGHLRKTSHMNSVNPLLFWASQKKFPSEFSGRIIRIPIHHWEEHLRCTNMKRQQWRALEIPMILWGFLCVLNMRSFQLLCPPYRRIWLSLDSQTSNDVISCSRTSGEKKGEDLNGWWNLRNTRRRPGWKRKEKEAKGGERQGGKVARWNGSW